MDGGARPFEDDLRERDLAAGRCEHVESGCLEMLAHEVQRRHIAIDNKNPVVLSRSYPFPGD